MKKGLSRRELLASASLAAAACKARPVQPGEDPLVEASPLPGLATAWPTLDPFLFCLHVGYPDAADEVRILQSTTGAPPPPLEKVCLRNWPTSPSASGK